MSHHDCVNLYTIHLQPCYNMVPIYVTWTYGHRVAGWIAAAPSSPRLKRELSIGSQTSEHAYGYAVCRLQGAGGSGDAWAVPAAATCLRSGHARQRQTLPSCAALHSVALIQPYHIWMFQIRSHIRHQRGSGIFVSIKHLGKGKGGHSTSG